jgi:hypothetical protein
LWEQGFQGIGPALPIHMFGKAVFRDTLTVRPRYGGAKSG